MKELNFLKKIKKEGSISKVEVSKNISKSYKIKSENCMKSAKILLSAGLYENSVSESYYSMYNMVLSLFFRCGIKSENHTGSIILLKQIFKIDNNNLKKAKKERIDKQYYVIEGEDESLTKENANSMIELAQDFINELESYIMDINEEKIEKIRVRFTRI
jgi:uncharacterized protein (UPF0332 family)